MLPRETGPLFLEVEAGLDTLRRHSNKDRLELLCKIELKLSYDKNRSGLSSDQLCQAVVHVRDVTGGVSAPVAGVDFSVSVVSRAVAAFGNAGAVAKASIRQPARTSVSWKAFCYTSNLRRRAPNRSLRIHLHSRWTN